MKGTSVFCPKAKEAVLLSFTAKHTTCDSHFLSLSSDQRLAKGSKTNRKVRLQVCQTEGAEMRFSTEELFFFQWSFIVVAFGNVRKIID